MTSSKVNLLSSY